MTGLKGSFTCSVITKGRGSQMIRAFYFNIGKKMVILITERGRLNMSKIFDYVICECALIT